MPTDFHDGHNLASKFAGSFEKQWNAQSYVKPHTNGNLNFDGVDTLEVYVPTTVPYHEFDRDAAANRYGDPKNIIPNSHRYRMLMDMAYTGVIELGSAKSRTIGTATGEWIKNQNESEVIPYEDRYALKKFANLGTIKEAGSLTGDTALAALENARREFVNKRVPNSNRVVWASPEFVGLIAESKQFTEIEKLTVDAVRKGELGQCKTFRIIEVPEDIMPTGVHFLAAHQSALVQADKLNELKIHSNPQGYSGPLIEARNLFDAFVIGSLAKGVYSLVETGKKQACSVKIASHTATITADGASDIKYTLDGSDPRFSSKAKSVVNGTVTTEAGQTIRVVAFGPDGTYTSDVANATDK